MDLFPLHGRPAVTVVAAEQEHVFDVLVYQQPVGRGLACHLFARSVQERLHVACRLVVPVVPPGISFTTDLVRSGSSDDNPRQLDYTIFSKIHSDFNRLLFVSVEWFRVVDV